MDVGEGSVSTLYAEGAPGSTKGGKGCLYTLAVGEKAQLSTSLAPWHPALTGCCETWGKVLNYLHISVSPAKWEDSRTAFTGMRGGPDGLANGKPLEQCQRTAARATSWLLLLLSRAVSTVCFRVCSFTLWIWIFIFFKGTTLNLSIPCKHEMRLVSNKEALPCGHATSYLTTIVILKKLLRKVCQNC